MPKPRSYSDLVVPPLETQIVAQRVLVYEEVDSTNDYALRLGGDGTLIVADRQTAGRGRQGRPWYSASGLGLWFSLGFDGHIEGLQIAAALAVRDGLSSYCELTVKWPNDLLYKGRKICGILVEHKDNRTALGIGINVAHTVDDFPEALRDTATSLYLATGKLLDRSPVLKEVLRQIDANVALMSSGRYNEIHDKWVAACGLLNRRVRWGKVEGVVSAIDGRGALTMETPEGEMQLLSGDIAVQNGEPSCC